jgi:hypothetical protein
MSKLVPILILSFTYSTAIYSQQPAPGGIAGAYVWCVSQTTGNQEVIWKDLVNGQIFAGSEPEREATQPLINFNVAYSFAATPGASIDLFGKQLNRSTIFSLYQSRDTITEKSIWSMRRSGQTTEVLTTNRLADLQRFEYINFSTPRQLSPKINTFLQNQEPDTAEPLSLQLAQPPKDHQLPITAFRGLFPEFIVYDRVLNPKERQQVESYLAIKYGIMLAPELKANYLNSIGAVLFAPAESGDYTHRITGIGRDDGSGLYQKQSTSSYAPGLVTLSIGSQTTDNTTNTNTLPDQHFLLWADNDQPLAWAEKPPLNPLHLQRKWLIKATGQWEEQPTEFRLDTKPLVSPAGPEQTYYLLVDRSGQGDFSGKSPLDSYTLSSLLPNGEAAFQSVRWDTDGSGEDAFTLAVGPNLLVKAALEPPNCQDNANGSIRFAALGGRAPFRYELRRNNQLIESWTHSDRAEVTVNDLPAGDYELLISDADGRQYRENFFFQSSDAPQIGLAAHYHLSTDGTLLLDAYNSDFPAAEYLWQGPNGQVHRNARLQITQAGTYQLEINDQGCVARKTIQVDAAPKGSFRKVELFPNPTSDGHFQLQVHLEQAAPLQIRIFDTAGRPILQQRLRGDSYHHTSGRLHVKGTYLIQLHSGSDQFTLPLIVQ